MREAYFDRSLHFPFDEVVTAVEVFAIGDREEALLRTIPNLESHPLILESRMSGSPVMRF